MKWRSKKNNVNLAAVYSEVLYIKYYSYDCLNDKVLEKLRKMEAKIKLLIDNSLKDSSSLVLQAKYLRVRLKSCVDHNQEVCNKELFTYNEASTLLEALRDRERALRSMLLFHDEVDRIRKNTGDSSYIPWDMRMSVGSKGSNESDRTVEKMLRTKKSIAKRLDKVVAMREFLDRNIKLLEDKYERMRSVLSHCRLALTSLENTVLKALSAPPHLCMRIHLMNKYI